MADSRGHVRPALVSKADTSGALGAAWERVRFKLGHGRFADDLEVDAKTINRAITGETLPELHHALNSLLVDPTALDEVIKLYGFELRPSTSECGNDIQTVAGLSHAAGKLAEALADGRRDHIETLELAEDIRPLLPRLSAIVGEADRLRGPRDERGRTQ